MLKDLEGKKQSSDSWKPIKQTNKQIGNNDKNNNGNTMF